MVEYLLLFNQIYCEFTGKILKFCDQTVKYLASVMFLAFNWLVAFTAFT